MNLKKTLRPIPLCLTLASAFVLTAVPGCAQESTAPAGAAESTEMSEDDKILYALGLALGQNLGPFSLTADELATVQSGLADSVFDKDPKVDLETYGPKIQGFAQARIEAAAAVEKGLADAFLVEEGAKEGAVTSDSGLIMTEIMAGDGASPTATDTVTVHYHGTLRDGSVFDSSVDRGTPATFPLGQVIPCWTEALQKIKVGGKSRVVCPASIAYGAQGRPGIPGNAALVFEVELLGIGEAEAAEDSSGDES